MKGQRSAWKVPELKTHGPVSSLTKRIKDIGVPSDGDFLSDGRGLYDHGGGLTNASRG